MIRSRQLPPRWLRFTVMLVLAIGIFFRFYNLDGKIFWHDEAATTVRISGHSFSEILEEFSDGNMLTVKMVKEYLAIDETRNSIDVIKGLATEEPQLTPVYFVFLRWWGVVFGNSSSALRSFSAVISLFQFPALYWLCWELFRSHYVAWVALGLFSVSPYHFLFAQEARPYSLWMVTILFSSATLLRALRVNSKKTWLLYSIATALSLWSFMLSILVLAGQGLYVFIKEKFRFNKTVMSFGASSAIALFSFLPWIGITFYHRHAAIGATNWVWKKIPLSRWIFRWMQHTSSVVLDLEKNFWLLSNKHRAVLAFVSLCVLMALYIFLRRAPKRVALFIACLALGTVSPLALPDLILGGVRSTSGRYIAPFILCCNLSLAYLIADGIFNLSHQLQFSKLIKWTSTVLFYFLLLCGFVSIALGANSSASWNKVLSQGNERVADIINQYPSPIVIECMTDLNTFSLLYHLDADVKIAFFSGGFFSDEDPLEKIESKIDEILDNYSTILLFRPRSSLLENLQQDRDRELDPLYEGVSYTLFQLKLLE